MRLERRRGLSEIMRALYLSISVAAGADDSMAGRLAHGTSRESQTPDMSAGERFSLCSVRRARKRNARPGDVTGRACMSCRDHPDGIRASGRRLPKGERRASTAKKMPRPPARFGRR
jgi:hypothetical protein